MAKLFDKEYLQKIFQKIGVRMERKTSAFVFGGGAMCFRNQKNGTKDLDIVLRNDSQAKIFSECVKKEGFRRPAHLANAYQMMKTYDVLENSDGFRFDIFSKKVCGALELSKGMLARAENLGDFGKLDVRLVSNEDVILFKGITERSRDADDIAAVVRLSRIDWNVILKECKAQSGMEKWYGLLHNKFAEIETKHGIRSPIMSELFRLDVQSALEEAYERRLNCGASKQKAIEELRKHGFSKKELEFLTKRKK